MERPKIKLLFIAKQPEKTEPPRLIGEGSHQIDIEALSNQIHATVEAKVFERPEDLLDYLENLEQGDSWLDVPAIIGTWMNMVVGHPDIGAILAQVRSLSTTSFFPRIIGYSVFREKMASAGCDDVATSWEQLVNLLRNYLKLYYATRED